MKHKPTETTYDDLTAAHEEFSTLFLEAVRPFETDSPAHAALYRVHRAALDLGTVSQYRGMTLALEAARMTADSRSHNAGR